jgi:hypothetical protein
MLVIGIDNGTSGAIAIKSDSGICFFQIPTFMEQNYTKAKGNISRIDTVKLEALLKEKVSDVTSARAYLERPLVNPGRFKATISGVRALEATLIVLERLGIGVQYIDSKGWQKELLPAGTTGSPELKKASRDIGIRLYPQYTDLITKQKDADALLIAEWAWRHR